MDTMLADCLSADECATVLATCLRPRRTGRGLERPKTERRRGATLLESAAFASSSPGLTPVPLAPPR